MLRGEDTAAGEVLLDSGEEEGLVDDQRGRQRHAEEGIETITQALRSILPVGQVIRTCGNFVCLQLSQETGAESSKWPGALGKADFYEGGELHKPALKYFPDLVQAIADEEPNDPDGRLDRAAGGALASLGDPYTQKLITDKELFYKAINKMLADKHSAGNRTAGMGLIADNMPLEDFHYVADMVVHATRGTDPAYTVYRGGSNTTEIGVGLLNRLNIQEAVEVCLDSFPTATRGKERARRIALFTSFGANAKPYLPRLRAALENDLKPDPNAEEDEGFTKDVSLNKA